MNTSINRPVRAESVRIESGYFFVILEDGRQIGVPYEWFWRLEKASQEQRENWRLIGNGMGIHWEDIDEDVSIAGLLLGEPINPAQPPSEKTTA